ncbi:MAG: FAD-dependent oxidoreductase [Candidatus Sulfotelmatobacter sp.]
MAKRVDILIIGGGSIGVCSAWFLADKGRQVTVVDRGQIGAACSYGNAGVIARSHIIPLPAPGVLLSGMKWVFNPESPLYIKPRLSLALISWLARFSAASRRGPTLRTMSLINDLIQASMTLYEEFASMGGSQFNFKHRGSLAIYKSSDGFEAGLKQAEWVRRFGIQSKVLDQAGVRQIEPTIQQQIVGGIYMKDDAHLNPFKFVVWLSARAQSKGVSFLTSTEVLGFDKSAGRISTVRTTRGDFEAHQVILAAGSWSPELAEDLGLTLPIQPAKGYSITVKSEEREGSMPIWLTESKVTVTPMGEVLRFAGTLELADLDFSINQRRVEAIRRAAREYLVGTDQYETLEIWRGLRPLTPDGLPIIGISKAWSNLIFATGHGMQGLALGPITGKLVTQLATGETPSVDMARLSEERFR